MHWGHKAGQATRAGACAGSLLLSGPTAGCFLPHFMAWPPDFHVAKAAKLAEDETDPDDIRRKQTTQASKSAVAPHTLDHCIHSLCLSLGTRRRVQQALL